MPRLLCSLLVTLALAGAISAGQQPAPSPNLPSADQTLQYLKETIDWYQQVRSQEQLAITPAEAMLYNDNRQIAKEIIQRSFDFAKAEAKLLSKQAAPSEEDQATEVAGYSGLSKAAAAAEAEVKDTQAELDSDKQKLQVAEGAKKRELQSTIDELQSELNLAKTRSDTFK